ncbi:hypothetical protein MHU86_21777 [Fragilaria crotonensis]|nr:hypothetical protein MHU86_21777 [Fragilaria crotonensis]
METNPLQVHRAIWYNFRFYIDQEMHIPPLLNKWAMDVSRVYLLHFDPMTLNETDTLAYSWKTMPFMHRMDTDDQSAWIPVQRRRRSKSPPNSTAQEQLPASTHPIVTPRSRASSEMSSPSSLSKSVLTVANRPNKKRSSKLSWSQGLPPVTTVTEEDEEEREEEMFVINDNQGPDIASQGTTTIMSKPPPHPNIPTNDGTHRVTVKWTPPENTHEYEKDKKKMNETIHEIVQTMVPPEVGNLYRWESEDLSVFKSAQNMTAVELRDFITPTITMAHSQSQIIFGLRIGFSVTPGQWVRSNKTTRTFKSLKLEVSISNSSSTSGKMVNAGYILLKAPNTTQVHRYTQFLRSLLPKNTPYFDVVRYKKTPMDQLIPHLRIHCGEKHVMPLCQALLLVLTGHGSALFIPRYALGTMTDEKIRSHFQVHERWARSLKAITMSPNINHLDQTRVEYNEDGTTTERSTREWASQLQATDNISSALCDVVNGTPDHKAYLLVPSQYFQKVQQEWRMYKSRLYPPNKPEWNQPTQELGTKSPPIAEGRERAWGTNHARARSNKSSEWPTPVEAAQLNVHDRNQTAFANKRHASEDLNSFGGTSIGTDEDKSTGSTHSLTHASKYSADARFSELEQSMQQKLDALDVSGKKSSQRLLSIEQQFSRIDDLDKKLAAVTDKLEIVTEHMEKSSEAQKHISTDMEEMKIQNTEQFAAMNKRLITNMENQHKMSTTMLDLHAHFEKLSAFMEDLATKMESDRTQATTTTRVHKKPATSSDNAQRAGVDNYSTSSASSDSGSSQSHANSVDSSASSIVYCSPEKKKQRSHRKWLGTRSFIWKSLIIRAYKKIIQSR